MDEYKKSQFQEPANGQYDPLADDFDFPLTMDEINAEPQQPHGINVEDALNRMDAALGVEEEPLDVDPDLPYFPGAIDVKPEREVVSFNFPPQAYQGFEPGYSEDRQTAFYRWLKNLESRAKLQTEIPDLKLKPPLKKTYFVLHDLTKKLLAHYEAGMNEADAKGKDHADPLQHRQYMLNVKKTLSDLSDVYNKQAMLNPTVFENEDFAPFKREILGVINQENRLVDSEIEKMDDVARDNIYRQRAAGKVRARQKLRAKAEPQSVSQSVSEEEPSELSASDIHIGSDNHNPDPIAQQRARILKCAKDLEKAKTLFNSREYKDLIDLMNRVGRDGFSKTEGVSRAEQFAYELSFLDHQVEKYLSHKAAEGVKKNALGKLGAVEAASRTISECASLFGRMDLPLNARNQALPQRVQDINPSLEKRLYSLPGDKISLAPELKEDYIAEVNQYVAKAGQNASNLEAVKQHISDVDSCMCKIAVKALSNGNNSVAFDVKHLRREFLKDPFSALSPERNAEAVRQKSESGPVL